jgi:hypothetical protein
LKEAGEADDVDCLLLLGEAHLQRGNFQDDESDSTSHRQAIEFFDRAAALEPGSLPEHFEDIIEDLKADLAKE